MHVCLCTHNMHVEIRESLSCVWSSHLFEFVGSNSDHQAFIASTPTIIFLNSLILHRCIINDWGKTQSKQSWDIEKHLSATGANSGTTKAKLLYIHSIDFHPWVIAIKIPAEEEWKRVEVC